MKPRIYFCIDLKSFYASVECIDRGLNPLTARLVVADPQRQSGTICLAVSPAMKALGVQNRCRVFQIPSNIDYIMAPPRMRLYLDYSARIYGIYLKYFSNEDMHVYSIDEVFIDITDYLHLYKLSPYELALHLMNKVLDEVGIPSACGIGTNLYLAKIALDITAKHAPNRIGFLDEDTYRTTLWKHKPLTDFWRIGPGIARRLSSIGVTTMKDIAETDPSLLNKLLGVDSELLIDHAWGRESTTISQIKSYMPQCNSLSSGQVLMRGYTFDEAFLLVREMVELLSFDLVEKCLVTDSIWLHIGYLDHEIPSLNKSLKLATFTSSSKLLIKNFSDLYLSCVSHNVLIKRINIAFNNIKLMEYIQYDLFTDNKVLEKERRIQKSVISIRNKYGKNSLIKASSLLDASTLMERNLQIGGHKA